MAAEPLNRADAATEGLVSIRLGSQTFGVPVMKAQDIIAQTAISIIPLAPPEVAGSLNLRGRIVTAIDMRRRLDLPPRAADEHVSLSQAQPHSRSHCSACSCP